MYEVFAAVSYAANDEWIENHANFKCI